MSLYRYKKVENYDAYPKDHLVLGESQTQRNAWNTMGDGYGILQSLVNSSFLANLIIPAFFISLGLFFIFKYIYPEIKYQIEKQNGLVSQGTTTPISQDYVDRSLYISNPAGLNEVSEEAFKQDILQDDTVSKNYNGIFYITIPALGIDSLPVTANVDSTTESSYNSILPTSLAHFQNTGLPISDIKNNIVIYGHSASPNYRPKPSDVEVAFSFLSNLKVGDEIYIDMDGQRYTYRMYRSKIVEPTDLSVITGLKNQRTLTLFTCWPAGNNSSRYVAIARPVE